MELSFFVADMKIGPISVYRPM